MHKCHPMTDLFSLYLSVSNPLTQILLNSLNGTIYLSVLELSIIIFRDKKMKTLCWSVNSIAPCQTAWMWPDSILVVEINHIGSSISSDYFMSLLPMWSEADIFLYSVITKLYCLLPNF